MRAGTGRRAASSARAWRTSPTALWPATSRRTTRRSRSSAAATSGRWAKSSPACSGCAPGRGWRRWGWWRSTARRCRPTRRSTPNRDFGQIAREILEEAAEVDRREDELYGTERGDELPEHLRTREGRRTALREAKERLDRERTQATEPTDGDGDEEVAVELDPERFVTRQ